MSNNLSNLINQRSDDESQVSLLQGQIGQALTAEESSGNISHVLDPAAVVPVSAKKVFLVDGLSGLLAGLAIGLVIIIFGALFAEAAPDRLTVAETVGAPVVLSLEHYRSPRLMRRARLARRLRAPDPAIRMIERRLRAQLESAPGSALAVVTMGTPEPAALGVGVLALDLSSEGHRVVVVDAADERLLTSMLGLSPPSDKMELFPVPSDEHSSLRLLVAPSDPLQMAEKLPQRTPTLFWSLPRSTRRSEPSISHPGSRTPCWSFPGEVSPWPVMDVGARNVAPCRDFPPLCHPLGFRPPGRDFRGAQPRGTRPASLPPTAWPK